MARVIICTAFFWSIFYSAPHAGLTVAVRLRGGTEGLDRKKELTLSNGGSLGDRVSTDVRA